MDIITLARIIIIPMAIMPIGIYTYKIYRNSNRISRLAISRVMIGLFLLSFPSILEPFYRGKEWINIIKTGSQYYAALFLYLGLYQLQNNKVYHPIRRSCVFWVTNVLSVISLVSLYVLGANYTSFIDNEPVRPTRAYIIHYTANYAIIIMIGILTMVMHSAVDWGRNAFFILRSFLFTIAALCISMACISAEVNILLSLVTDNIYRYEINHIYHIGKLLFAIFTTAGILITALPENIRNVITRPIDKYKEKRMRRRYLETEYLYSVITKVVPKVVLNQGVHRYDDMLLEIADARMIIWSNEPEYRRNTARKEADIIMKYFVNGNTIDETGGCEIRHIIKNEIEYNKRVVKYLKEMGV